MLLVVEKPELVFVGADEIAVPNPVPLVGEPRTPLELMGEACPLTVGVVTPGPAEVTPE
jgi:hypothetical protein